MEPKQEVFDAVKMAATTREDAHYAGDALHCIWKSMAVGIVKYYFVVVNLGNF